MTDLSTRADICREVRRLLALSAGADEPAASRLMARANELVAVWELDRVDLLDRPRSGHPLVRITAGRIAHEAIDQARADICRSVRRAADRRARPDVDDQRLDTIATGARWRRGSNSWRPNAMRGLRDEREPEMPCPNCGAPGEELGGQDGYEACSACRQGFAVGDYDWSRLADCVRYAADLAAGDVEDNNRCRSCDRLFDEALFDVFLNQREPFCGRGGCPFGGDLVLHDPFAVEVGA